MGKNKTAKAKEKSHFSFAQNFRRTAKAIGVDFVEKQHDGMIMFLAKHQNDENIVKIIADAS